jgi:hypothetical protein
MAFGIVAIKFYKKNPLFILKEVNITTSSLTIDVESREGYSSCDKAILLNNAGYSN